VNGTIALHAFRYPNSRDESILVAAVMCSRSATIESINSDLEQELKKDHPCSIPIYI